MGRARKVMGDNRKRTGAAIPILVQARGCGGMPDQVFRRVEGRGHRQKVFRKVTTMPAGMSSRPGMMMRGSSLPGSWWKKLQVIR